MTRNDLRVDQLDNTTVLAFLADRRSTFGRLPPASVLPLLAYLREEGVVGEEVTGPVTPFDRLLVEYRESVLNDRGLEPVTVRGYEQLARRSLEARVSAVEELGVGA